MELFSVKQFLTYFVVFSFGSLLAFGKQSVVHSRQKRIIGGRAVDDGMFPWLASLQTTVVVDSYLGIMFRAKTYHCGASVLNNRWLLTAAHCFRIPDAPLAARDPSNWYVTAGESNKEVGFWERLQNFWGSILDEPELRVWQVQVDAVILHPNYSPNDTWLNDIALVHLSTDLPTGAEHSGIDQINLPSPLLGGSREHVSRWPAPGVRCIMLGWGCTEVDGPIENQAQMVELPVVDTGDCHYSDIGPSRLCAGRENVGSVADMIIKRLFSSLDNLPTPEPEMGICPGDSGGPLVCQFKGNWLQAGVASYTSAQGPGRYPGVFTRVSYYVDWIEESITAFDDALADNSTTTPY